MAKSIERFAVSEKGFSLPVRNVLTGRGFVTGKSGSGKSNTASVVAEELLERGLGLMIIDTDGEYHGLKERYELLQVGGDDRCDREVTAEDAGLIADLALEENVPIILDVSGYMDEEVAQDVIHAVVRELFVAEKHYQKPFLLFVEEAHEFIPEKGGGDDVHKMLVRVAKRGRKRGLGICAMSQRPAAVSKDYITQCDWLVWHRLTWENDTKVAGRILGGDARDSVQSLGDGEALVMTDWDEKISRVQFRRKKTVDEGSTPDLLDAYGPPSAREDHVSREEPGAAESEGDEPASGVDEAETEATAAAESDAEGGSAADDADSADAEAGPGAVEAESDAAGADPDVDEEAPEDVGGDPGVAGDGQPQAVTFEEEPTTHDAESNWDLSDVDISPRRHAETAAGSTGRSGAGSSAGAAGVGTKPGSAGSSGSSSPTGSEAGSAAGRGVAAEGATSERRPKPSRPRIEEPEEYDPVWELGQFFVYCYVVVVAAHGRLRRRIERFLIARFAGLRRRAIGSRRHPGRGRIGRRLARAISLSLVVAFYGVALWGIVWVVTA